MADFTPTQQEISNIVDPQDTTVVLVDGTNPAYKAVINSSGALLVTGSSGTFQVKDNSAAVLGTDLACIIAGYDGTNYQFISVDSNGHLQILSSQLPSALVGGRLDVNIGSSGITLPISGTVVANQGSANSLANAWPIKITDGINVSSFSGDRLKVDTPTTSQVEEATFIAISLDTTIGNDKSMMSIVNTHATLKTKIKQIVIRNAQTGAVTGVMADFRLLRCTGHSNGTLLTPEKRDTADSVDAAITVRTGSTIAGEATTPLDRWKWSSDEYGTGTLDQEGLDHAFMNSFPASSIFDPSEKRITLRQNEGITLKQVTNSTNGSFDIIIIFTVV